MQKQSRIPPRLRKPDPLPRRMTCVTIFDDQTMEPKFDLLCYGLRVKDLAWVGVIHERSKLPEDFKASGGQTIRDRLERRGISEGHYASIFAMREER